jgi:hypothetical protein
MVRAETLFAENLARGLRCGRRGQRDVPTPAVLGGGFKQRQGLRSLFGTRPCVVSGGSNRKATPARSWGRCGPGRDNKSTKAYQSALCPGNRGQRRGIEVATDSQMRHGPDLLPELSSGANRLVRGAIIRMPAERTSPQKVRFCSSEGLLKRREEVPSC